MSGIHSDKRLMITCTWVNHSRHSSPRKMPHNMTKADSKPKEINVRELKQTTNTTNGPVTTTNTPADVYRNISVSIGRYLKKRNNVLWTGMKAATHCATHTTNFLPRRITKWQEPEEKLKKLLLAKVSDRGWNIKVNIVC